MKYRDLIIAAMDGKPFQVRVTGAGPTWTYWPLKTVFDHFSYFPDGKSNFEYRLKPEPVPDKVSYGAIGFATVTEATKAKWVETVRNARYVPVMVTAKTDENGVVTEHVEIVK